MADYRVEWIEKPGGSSNPRTRIQRLGGNGWNASESDVIRYIQGNMHRFYVTNGSYSSWIEIGHHNQVPYLRTQSDGTPIDNLLWLPNISR